MKSIFIDTNVLMDFLRERKPFIKYAIEIFGLAESEKIQLYTSSQLIATKKSGLNPDFFVLYLQVVKTNNW